MRTRLSALLIAALLLTGLAGPAAPARANGNPPAQRPAPTTGFGAPVSGEDDIPF